MNKLVKRFLAALMSTAVVLTVVPVASLNVNAAGVEVEEAEEVIIKELDDIVLSSEDMDGYSTKAILDVVVSPSTANQKIVWTSSDEAVVYVGSDGLVSALKPGFAVVTATAVNGISSTVNVTVVSKPSSLTLNKKKLTLKKGKSFQIKTTLPAFEACPSFTYTTSDKKVATVSKTGVIKAKKKGTAVITVTCDNDTSVTAKIKLKVK